MWRSETRQVTTY